MQKPGLHKAKILAHDLEKPDLDNRAYRVIELPNKLQVCLIHDADTDKSSASVDVRVGNFCDSEELPGQAHAVEHLLFMGTEKYPQENEYSTYLSAHSGQSNAYTADLSTNYHFEVGHEYLYGALDRFAQFFICPLFLEESMDRELRAVDSENKKNLQNDVWRLHQLDKSLSNPKHPYCHFSTGNLQTLRDLPAKRGISVRDEFIKFHSEHYSANLLKLVVLGRESLDQLQAWVEELFEGVKNKDFPEPKFEGQAYTEKELLTQVFAKPVMDTREINITFRFFDETEYYESHPSRYLSHLIGHEGPGSILAYLKARGWVDALNAGPTPCCNDSAFFHIEAALTEDGLEHYQDVVEIVFRYINLIKDTPVQEWVFDELKNVATVDFKFRQKSPASKTTSRLSSSMQKPYPREQILSSSTLLRKYDPAVIQKALSYLRPDNFKLDIIAQKIPCGEFTDKEKWYGTEYRREKIPKDFLSRIQATAKKGLGAGAELQSVLHLPHKNEFIPTKFDVVKKPVETPSIVPTLIRNDDLMKVWHKKDDCFWVPKANIFITLRNPLVYASPNLTSIIRMYCELVKDSLNEYAYDAEIAGLEYAVQATPVGIDVDVTGFNDKMAVLLEKVLIGMRDLEVKPERFKVIKDRTVKYYSNWGLQIPYYQVVEHARNLNQPMSWTTEEIGAEFEHMTVEDVRGFFPQVLRSVQIEMLAHGNLYSEDALKYADLVKRTLSPRPLPPCMRNARRSLVPPQGTKVMMTRDLADPANVNHAIEYDLWIGERVDRLLRMKLSVFSQIAEEPCFDQLRTKEQLGYIVFSGSRSAATIVLFRILVQSERSAPYLESRIENFLLSMEEKLDKMTDAEFTKHVNAVIIRRTEKFKNLNQESNRFWGHISSEFYDFEQIPIETPILKELKKADIIEFYKTYIHPDSPVRRKSSFHMNAAKAVKVLTEEQAKASLAKKLTKGMAALGIDLPQEPLKKALASADLLDKASVPQIIASFAKQNYPDRVQDISSKLLAVLSEKAASLEKIISHMVVHCVNYDHGVVLEDIAEYKASLPLTSGATPIRPLVQFQETNPKL